MRALIVDDEAPARAKVRRLLEGAPDVEIAGEARTGREAVALFKRSRADIVFLDIQMPGLDGFGVIDAIRDDEPPFIVFVTADAGQALRAFEVGAVEYLLKPFTPQRFAQVLERARARLAHVVTPTAATPAVLRRVLVFEDDRASFIAIERIDRIEADRNYVVLHVGRERHRLRSSIAALSGRLDPAHFLRINRSTIVRLDAITSIAEWSHGDYRVVMNDGTAVMWSRRFRGRVEREFGVKLERA